MHSARQDLNLKGSDLVSVLPGLPVEGQLIYFQDATMATGGVVWQLRYRASNDPYKWEFVGGSRLNHFILTEEALGGTLSAYQDLATVGPSITAPLTGYYDASFNCYSFDTSATVNTTGAAIKIGAAAASQPAALASVPASGYGCLASSALIYCVTAEVVKLQYRSPTSDATKFGYRNLSLTPVQVG